MSPCHPFRPVPGQCGPNRRGPLPAPPFDPRDYWATKKFVSSLFESIETKIDKFDVVDPSAEAEAGKAADAKSTYEGLNRVLGVASDARVLAESKADKATTLAGYGITDAATKAELAAKADLTDGKVPASQLPSYVDDVLEYDTMSAFPANGESGKIYVAKDTNKTYRWSGTQYVEISPLPVLDDTVTEKSPNGVKSSGIWSWVKSLLPHWLTSDYAEPATVESVANKRDKSDRAVYSVTQTENTDWTWTSENKELEAALNAEGIKIKFHDDNIMWNAVADPSGWAFAPAPGTKSDLSVVMYFIKGPEWIDQYPATAARPRYMDETPGPAKQDQQIAAVATDDAAKPADGSLMKYDTTNDRFVKAVEGVDYLKTHQDISGKFDATHDFDGESASLSWEAFYLAVRAPHGLYVLRGGMMADEHDELGRYVRTHSLERKADRATTLSGYGITDAAPLSMISATDTTFASAVRAVPTTDMPEDMPTDWGAYGTVGAALAALAAGLKWIKNILGSVASGYSTFAEWIASKYTKPSGGIPASDLALTVQSSLDAADAAAPQATTYTKDETDAAIRAGSSLGQMTNLGNGRYEYTGALKDASTQTYPREVA